MEYQAQLWHDLGIAYQQWVLDLAAQRGWNAEAHLTAVLATDEDAIATTHPYNYLTEFEAEQAYRMARRLKRLWYFEEGD